MADAKRTAAPAAYLPIENALRSIEAGVADALVARRLEAVDHPCAERAAALLRVGRWRQAADELEAALEELAGPDDARDLAWFKPATEPAPPTPLPWTRPRADPSGRS
jgi:hypothetical protein